MLERIVVWEPNLMKSYEFFRHTDSVESTKIVKYFCKKMSLEPTASSVRDRDDTTEP